MKLLVFQALKWCGPCRQLHKVIENYIAVHPEVKDQIEFLDVDEEANHQLAIGNGVLSIPTIMLVNESRGILKRSTGVMSASDFEDFIRGML